MQCVVKKTKRSFCFDKISAHFVVIFFSFFSSVEIAQIATWAGIFYTGILEGLQIWSGGEGGGANSNVVGIVYSPWLIKGNWYAKFYTLAPALASDIPDLFFCGNLAPT